jgi:hypothetical protein
MSVAAGGAPPLSARVEMLLVTLAVWAGFCAIPLALGEIGIGWDALNHHFYLGWVADRPRFDRDFLAASYQSYQYPYLYWPIFKLAQVGASGVTAGVVLATLHALAVPPVWMVTRTLVPEASWFGAALRVLAVLLAFLSILVLSFFDSTANDLLATVPLAWAVALSIDPGEAGARRAFIAGVLGGVSVAFKLSNGLLAILLPILWLLAIPGTPMLVARRVVAGCLGSGLGFVLAYGFWGWQLWLNFGNPLYPFAEPWFAPVRAFTGWQQP